MKNTSAAEALLLQQIAGPGIALLEQNVTVRHIWRSEDATAEIAGRAATARAVLTGAGTGIAREQIAAIPKLEIIWLHGVGVDAVDLDHCRRADIRVTSTPDVLTEDVADMPLELMLSVFRDIPQGDRFVREGRWGTNPEMPLSRRVSAEPRQSRVRACDGQHP